MVIINKLIFPGVKINLTRAEFGSPELLSGGQVDKSSDMWSLGVVAHVLLTGVSPFLGSNRGEIREKVVEGDAVLQEDEWKLVSDEALDFVDRFVV